MRINKKGFTLVELLVAISILAILTLLAIPTLRAFQSSNSKTHYLNYKKALTTSGKLYNDSYSEDLFGNASYGCQKVNLTEMIYKKIAKDIELKDVSCNISSKDSYIIVKKYNNEYKYQASLYCENSKHVEQYSDKDNIISDCINDTGVPWIDIESVNNTTKNTKNKSVAIILLDNYGFKPKQEIKYAWSTSESAPAVTSSLWKNYSYNNEVKKTSGGTVKLKSNSITIPGSNTGNYYLYVKPVKVQNILDQSFTETKKYGPFRFDHTAPKCNQITVTPNISVNAYSKEVKFDFSYASSLDDLKSYALAISYDDGVHWTTVKTGADKTYTSYTVDSDGDIRYKLTNLVDYAENKTLECPMSGVFHRDTKPPTCTIKIDGTKSSNSGYYYTPTKFNISSKELDSISYGMNTNNSAVYNKQKTITVNSDGDNNIYGFVRDKAGNLGSCSKSLTTTKKYTVTFNGNGGTANPSTKQVYWGDKIGSLATATMKGYDLDEWYSEKSGGKKISTSTVMPRKNVTYYARWKVQSYKCLAGQYLKKDDTSCSQCKAGYYCPGGTYSFNQNADQGINQCPSHYTSVAGSVDIGSCYINVSAGNYLTTKNTSITDKCRAGTYKGDHKVYYGNTSSCTKCPSGYTSVAGTTAQSSCYINVRAGNYLKTKNTSITEKCGVGTYRGEHKVYYGNTSGCINCPSGYTSVAGTTAQSSCYMNVSAGRYVATANASSTVICPVNTYGGFHTVYYGKTSGCTNCPSGRTCPAGSTSSSACKYNAKINGGVEVICWKDDEGWYGECDGVFPFGTTKRKSGNWKITVDEHSITFDGTNKVKHKPGRTYEFDVYSIDGETYLGNGKQFVKTGHESYVVIKW